LLLNYYYRGGVCEIYLLSPGKLKNDFTGISIFTIDYTSHQRYFLGAARGRSRIYGRGGG